MSGEQKVRTQTMITTSHVPTIAPLQLAPGEVRFYNDEGYLVIPGLLNCGVLDAIRGEILDVMDASGAPPDSAPTKTAGRETKRR